jgi:asparagine synthase (glutamine-hydrolysing)
MTPDDAEQLDEFPDITFFRKPGPVKTWLHVEQSLVVVVNGSPRFEQSAGTSRDITRDPAGAIYEAYLKEGPGALANLCGEFAVVIFAPAQGSLFGCVDRMGIRPLAYSFDGESFAVGSSAVACARALRSSPAVSEQSVFDYVYFHVIPSPATIFDDVFKLPPAHYLDAARGRVQTTRYWAPEFYGHGNQHARGPRHDELLPCIEQAVAATHEGFERVGCYLSGGLDSSTMAGVLAGQLNEQPVDAYTVGFAQQGYDEMEFARAAADRFGLRLHEMYISIDDIVDLAQRVTAAFDEPFGNSSAIPSLFCAAGGKADGIDLMIAGDGGDELFGGNERYAKQKVFDVYGHIPSALRDRMLEPMFAQEGVLSRLPGFSKVASYIDQARTPMPGRTQSYNFVEREQATNIFTAEFLSKVEPGGPKTALQEEYAVMDGSTLVDQMLFLDWKFILADNDLRKVGRTASAAGVSVGYPLLDNGVVDFSLRLPASEKVKRLELRHYYKAALRDFLPAKIINKSKHGFGLPFGEWLKTSDALKSLVNPAVARLVERGILQDTFVSGLHRRHEQEHAAFYGNILWVLFMLENWLATHLD